MLSRESPKRPKGIAVYVILPVPPSLVITQVKKNKIKLPSNRHLPTPNISFSPSSLHFRSNFPLLLTFSGHFFLPILFLSPQNKGGVGGRLGDFVREKFVFQA